MAKKEAGKSMRSHQDCGGFTRFALPVALSVRQAGFEPTTDGFVDRSSIQLRYWRMQLNL